MIHIFYSLSRFWVNKAWFENKIWKWTGEFESTLKSKTLQWFCDYCVFLFRINVFVFIWTNIWEIIINDTFYKYKDLLDCIYVSIDKYIYYMYKLFFSFRNLQAQVPQTQKLAKSVVVWKQNTNGWNMDWCSQRSGTLTTH